MATRTISVAGGNYNATATWDEGVVPTASDDVVARAGGTSGNLVVNAGSACRSIDLTNYTGTMSGASQLTVGTTTAGPGNVAVKLVAGMTLTWTGTLSIASTSATQQTITSAGKSLSIVTFNGVGASWLLSDSMTTTGSVTLTNGTLNTNSLNHTFNSFITGVGTKTLTLGSSAITISGTAWTNSNPTNLTVTTNTATVTMGTTSSIFGGNVTNWGGMSLVMSGSGLAQLTGAGTLGSVTRTGSANKTDTFLIGNNITITGTLSITGNSETNRMLVNSTTFGTQRTLTVTTLGTFTNVDFTDMNIAGTASPISGTSLANGGGNAGITFTTPTTRYAVGAGSFNYSDATHWSASSGGAGGATIPLIHDTAIFDQNGASGGPTLSLDMPRIGTIDGTARNLTSWGLATASITVQCYGSFIAPALLAANVSAPLSFVGRGSNTINIGNKAFTGATSINCLTGTYTVGAFLTVSSSVTLTLTSGTLDLAGFGVSTGFFAATGGTLTSSSGTPTVSLTSTATGTTWNVSGTFAISSSIGVTFSVTAGNTRTFAGNGLSYKHLTHTIAGSTGIIVITGSNTFDAINFSDVTNARTLRLTAGTTQTITSAGGWNVNGTSGKLMSVVSATAGTAATVSVASGVVASDFLSLQDITATGGASFYAGSNSTNVSGNTGWVFTTVTPVVLGASTAVLSSQALVSAVTQISPGSAQSQSSASAAATAPTAVQPDAASSLASATTSVVAATGVILQASTGQSSTSAAVTASTLVALAASSGQSSSLLFTTASTRISPGASSGQSSASALVTAPIGVSPAPSSGQCISAAFVTASTTVAPSASSAQSSSAASLFTGLSVPLQPSNSTSSSSAVVNTQTIALVVPDPALGQSSTTIVITLAAELDPQASVAVSSGQAQVGVSPVVIPGAASSIAAVHLFFRGMSGPGHSRPGRVGHQIDIQPGHLHSGKPGHIVTFTG